MNPAIDAHPNDGFLDVYLSDDMPRLKYLSRVPTYVSGGYKKLQGDVHHFQGKKISIASETVMCICVDGGTYYENFVEYEILPGAISFACPQAIDLNKIPRIYSKTKKQEGW
jgi:diacylglycerol kinase family enzyme